MKNFLHCVVEWKTGACLMFTGSMIVYGIICLIMGISNIKLVTVLSILVVCLLGTFIQFLAFTDRIIKNMRYSFRLLVFAIPFAVVLCGCAFLFKWFPAQVAGAWLLFIGIFLLVFIACTFGFEVYYRITGRKYDGLLGQYKKQKEESKNKHN